MFKLFAGAHDAEVGPDLAKVSKERMVGRVARLSASAKGDISKAKKAALKKELKAILSELGAREEALAQIVTDLTE